MPSRTTESTARHRRQTRLITLGSAVVILLLLLFGALSLSRFQAAETAWEEHNTRATAIGEAQTEIARHIGYGGFIHNFKNLILRRDLPRYQAAIEADIAGFRVQSQRLERLLHVPADQAALAQLRATLEDYADKYRLVAPLVAAGATPIQIDAVVKIDDRPALNALNQLNSRAMVRAQQTQATAQTLHNEAIRFSRFGGALMLIALIAATWGLRRFLNHLLAAKQQIERALVQQQKMQDELVQVEKLAALGALVAGVAHEVNTPIGVTLSAATHLEAETQKTDRAYQAGELSEEGLSDYFATARQATQLMALNSQRASDLIQSFKQIAVDQTGGERRSFGVAQYIDEVLLSLRPHLKKSPVLIRVDCPPTLMLDSLPGAFSQVLTNLVMNALLHAFEPEQSGHIDISVAAINSTQLRLSFSDDGKGIAPELHTRVFEPFFTTRRANGGSGLGLHIVHNIVTQALKGSLTLHSRLGEGTTFTLLLPRSLADTALPTSALPTPALLSPSESRA